MQKLGKLKKEAFQIDLNFLKNYSKGLKNKVSYFKIIQNKKVIYQFRIPYNRPISQNKNLHVFKGENFLNPKQTAPGVKGSMGIMLINHHNSHADSINNISKIN